MSGEPIVPRRLPSLELPVEELLRRARPLTPREEMLIEDLDEVEGLRFSLHSTGEPVAGSRPDVIDTDVYGAELVPGSGLAEL